ncbi:MAG TPA: hypothetical protein VFP84_26470 [Kofleriaceae bacterium]|nr:hypothetical protein [Kofleriaceae bacterium]
MTSFLSELATYVGRVRQFERRDWAVYVAWVATIAGLAVATAGFLWIGARHGVVFPAEAYLVPIGAAIFTIAIAIDTIGHRTVYREAIRGGEQLVHHITIACGVGSILLVVLAYRHPAAVIPGLVLTALSVVYSLVDEAFHWRRYVQRGADRVEMWSHVAIFVGHLTMVAAWWRWYDLGYPGVGETLGYVG